MNTLLLVVDAQNDFCEGGTLACTGGAETCEKISKFYEKEASNFDFVVASKDWHVDPGSHWATDATEADMVSSYPKHCEAGSWGAKFHPNISGFVWDDVFLKGQYKEAFSPFEGVGNFSKQSLDTWCKERDISTIEIVGIALDRCVEAGACDAVKHGYTTIVYYDLTASVFSDQDSTTIERLSRAGVVTVSYSS